MGGVGAGTHHQGGFSGVMALGSCPCWLHRHPPPSIPSPPQHPQPAGEQSLGKGWACCSGARHPPVHFLHRGHSCPHLHSPPRVSPQKTRKKQCEGFFFFPSLAIIKKDSPFRALSIPGGREEREGRKGKTLKEKRGRAWEGEEKGGKKKRDGEKLKRRLHKGNSSTFEALAKLGRGRRGQGGSGASRPLSQSPLLSRMSQIPVETRSQGCGAEGNGRGEKKKKKLPQPLG